MDVGVDPPPVAPDGWGCDSGGATSFTLEVELSGAAESGGGGTTPSESVAPPDPVGPCAMRASTASRHSFRPLEAPAFPATARPARAAATAAPGPRFHTEAITRASRSAKFSCMPGPGEPSPACGAGADPGTSAAPPISILLPSGHAEPTRESGLSMEPAALLFASAACRGSAVHTNVKTLLRPSFSPMGVTAVVPADPRKLLRLLFERPPPPEPAETGYSAWMRHA